MQLPIQIFPELFCNFLTDHIILRITITTNL